MGCGQPGGESGFNVARVAALLAGLPDVPGVTVNRYCSSSLQTIRMAAHAIRAGEGDVFVAAGVETVSRYRYGASDTGPHNEAFAEAEARTAARAPAVTEPWSPQPGLPDVYIAMGQTAENVAEAEKVSREEMDEFALLSQTRAVESQSNGFFEREIIPVTLPDGTVSRDDGPRANTTLEGLGAQARVPRGRPRDRRERVPSQRRRRGGRRHERHTRARPRHHSARADRELRGVGAQPRDHGPRSRRGVPPGLGRAEPRHRDIDLVEINEAFAAQVIPSARHLGIPWDKLNVRGGAIALGHPFGQTGRTDHDDAAQRARGRRRDLRPRVDVRRRRPGHGDGGRATALTRTDLADAPSSALVRTLAVPAPRLGRVPTDAMLGVLGVVDRARLVGQHHRDLAGDRVGDLATRVVEQVLVLEVQEGALVDRVGQHLDQQRLQRHRQLPSLHASMSASTVVVCASRALASGASTFSRRSGSVFDGRRLNHQSP